MYIKTIKNGWLVTENSIGNYLGESASNEEFCGSKQEVLDFIAINLFTHEEIQAQVEKQREEQRQAKNTYIAGTFQPQPL